MQGKDSEFFTPILSQVSNPVTEKAEDMFLTVVDKHAPIVTRRVRGKSLPWLTPEIKNLMREREYQHKKAIKTNNEVHWSR